MLASSSTHPPPPDQDFETAQQLQTNLNSILNLFKDQKLVQKRAKQDLQDEQERQVVKLRNLHVKALAEKDDRIQDLIRENERLQGKCFDFEQKLDSLRKHYDQLDCFRNSMISVLQSTAPSLLLSSDSNNNSKQSRPTSRNNSNHTLITAAAQDQAFAMNARSFILESTASLLQQDENQRLADLDSALSDETAKPASNDQRLGVSSSASSCKPSAPFSNQVVRPPTLLESALNDSFFEKVKQEQEKAIVKSDDEELNIPELFHDTTFEQSGMLSIELLEPPIMGIDTTIDHIQRQTRQQQKQPQRDQSRLPEPAVDPATLYRQIRECVSPLVFEQFADCIAKFNNGMDTAATIKEIESLVPDERLRSLMNRLILDASLA